MASKMSVQTKKLLVLETNVDDDEEEICVSSFEKLLEGVVADGRYQWTLLIAFLIPLSLFYAIAFFNFILLLSTPKHHCHVPGRSETNFTADEWANLTIPWEIGPDGQTHLSQCTMYNVSQESGFYEESIAVNSSSVIDCQYGWDYDNSKWKETPVTKFDWVCDKKSYVTAIFSLNMAGSAVGTLLLSILSDRFGRKPIFYVALFLNLIFGNALIFAPSYTYFLIFKFLGTMAFFSIYQMPYIIVVELCNERLRTVATYATWFMFIISTVCLSLAGLLVPEWKTFLLVTQLPLAIFIFYWRFIPESPRWLLSRGKLDECEKVMNKIATTNGVKFTKELRLLMEKAYEEGKHKVPVSKIFTSATLTKHLFLITISHSLAVLCANSLNIHVHNMKGNIFLNYLFLRSFELPGDIFSTATAYLIGRRMNAVLCMLLASISIMIASFFITGAWSLITMCGITKIFLRAEIYTGYIYTGELFPTPLRSTAYGICGTVTLMATVLSPALISLGDIEARLPYYTICGLCIICAVVASFLPETIGNPLPQTIKEAKQIGKGQSYFAFNRKGNANKATKRVKTNINQDEETEERILKT